MAFHSAPTNISVSPNARPVFTATSSSWTSSRRESFSLSSTLSNPYSSCTHSSYHSTTTERPSAYVSDADLWGDDDDGYLSEPPPPPRSAEVWMARPLLPPVVSIKPRRCSPEPTKQKRRSSSASSKGKT